MAVTSSAGSYDVTYVTESTDAFTWEEPIEKIRRQHNQQGIFIWYRMLVHMFYMTVFSSVALTQYKVSLNLNHMIVFPVKRKRWF